jgi:hypothetical protein
MGEYGLFQGEQVKLGTCEDMYYLRAQQARFITKIPHSLDPNDPSTQKEIRFRFPWPDEDNILPGCFDDHDRAVPVPGITPPAGVDHRNVQFVAREGYLASLPCPESGTAIPGVTIHRNGFGGAVKIVRQAYRNGHLALIGICGGCGAMYNYPTWADVEPVIVACRAQADKVPSYAPFSPAEWHKVADRIAAGYTNPQGT